MRVSLDEILEEIEDISDYISNKISELKDLVVTNTSDNSIGGLKTLLKFKSEVVREKIYVSELKMRLNNSQNVVNKIRNGVLKRSYKKLVSAKSEREAKLFLAKNFKSLLNIEDDIKLVVSNITILITILDDIKYDLDMRVKLIQTLYEKRVMND